MDKQKIAYNNAWKFSFTPRGKALAKEKVSKAKGFVEILLGDDELIVPATAKDYGILKNGGYEVMVETTNFKDFLEEAKSDQLKIAFEKIVSAFKKDSMNVFKVSIEDAMDGFAPNTMSKLSSDEQNLIKSVVKYITKNYTNLSNELVSMLIDSSFRKQVFDSSMAKNLLKQIGSLKESEVDEIIGLCDINEDLKSAIKGLSSDEYTALRDWYFSIGDAAYSDIPDELNISNYSPELQKAISSVDAARKTLQKALQRTKLGSIL